MEAASKLQLARLPEDLSLLGLFVIGVLAAGVAELGEFEAASRGLLVLGCRVVSVLALRALKSDDFAHVFFLV